MDTMGIEPTAFDSRKPPSCWLIDVRTHMLLVGLEPTRLLKAPDFKSGASTNFATKAFAFGEI